jgi:hypothetical protein
MKQVVFAVFAGHSTQFVYSLVGDGDVLSQVEGLRLELVFKLTA